MSFVNRSLLLIFITLIRTLALRVSYDHSEWRGHNQPDFQQWRHGVSGQHTQLVQADRPIKWPPQISLEKLNSCAGQILPHLHSNLTGPLSPQESAFWGSLSLVDHLYVLCIQCNKLRIPLDISTKISVLNGLASDACLSEVTSHHLAKVTDAHKLLVHDARAKKYKTIAIVEEDYIAQAMPGGVQENLSSYFSQKDWEVIRLGFFACFAAKENLCQCNCFPENTNICRMKSGCPGLHGSHAYMLPQRSFETVINGGGIIDLDVLGRLRSSVLVPMIAFSQTHKTQEKKKQSDFIRHCIPHTSF